MGPRKVKKKAQVKAASGRPPLLSYDSGHEHSVQHWLELQKQIEDADRERPVVRPAVRAQAG
jgi:hypothetical protein